MIKHSLFLGLLLAMPLTASTIIKDQLKSGSYTQTTLTPKLQLYTVDVSQLEAKLDQYRLVYGIGQVAHGIMYYSWNQTYPND